MGHRPRLQRNDRRAPGACVPGRTEHEGEPVITLTGETVAHICRHCLIVVVEVGRIPLESERRSGTWAPYSDDGRPLPMLPDPGRY